MAWRDALNSAAAQLAAVSATPRLDAELLLAHAAGTDRETLLLGGIAGLPEGFDVLVTRRLAREPIAYILGRRDFWTIALDVGPAVLVPRADSETLIEAAVAHFAGTVGPARVLDLGTGSGALLLAALAQWPQATGLGVDRSPLAVAVARANAERLGFADRAAICQGDWASGEGAFDLILCNPPYVAADEALPPDLLFEPPSALFAGADGLDDHRRIAPLVAPRLESGGVACLEIGHDQARRATALYATAGVGVAVRRDLGGRDRCLVVTIV